MIAVYCSIALLGILIFLLGLKVGAWQYESATRQRIKKTGFFYLDNGFYRAVQIGIDMNKPQKVIEPKELPDIVETPVTPENVFRQPETVQPEKPRTTRRRIVKSSITH